VGYNPVAESTGLSSFVLPLLPLKSAKSREILRKFELIAVQGHPRSSTLVPICYEIQYTWTARSTETETETGLDRYVMLGARWLTEY